MRAAALQLNSTDDAPRNIERAVAPRRRGRRGRAPSWSSCPRSGRCSAPARCLPSGRRRSRGTRGSPPAGRLRASTGSRSSPARCRSASTAPSASANTSALIDPEGEIVARYRKIHMFDVDVGGVAYRESEFEMPGDEAVLAEADLGGTPVPGRAHRLLRPALPRALQDPRPRRRPADLDPVGVHRGDRRAALGGARPGPRDRGPALRRRREPGRVGAPALRVVGALDDLRSLGHGARLRRGGRGDRRRGSRPRPAREHSRASAGPRQPASGRVRGSR